MKNLATRFGRRLAVLQPTILTTSRFTEAPEEPTTSWHTVFAHGDAVERLQNVQIGCADVWPTQLQLRADRVILLRRSLVFVEAAFQVRNQREEASGSYSTQVLATHGKSPALDHSERAKPCMLTCAEHTERMSVISKPRPREEAEQ